jgi:hypothetical protein
MKRGNERLEMLRPRSGAPREKIVDPISGNKICTCDFSMPLFEDDVNSVGHMQDKNIFASTDTQLKQRSKSIAIGKTTHGAFVAVSNYKIPKLTNKKVKAEGRVPRILMLRARAAEIAEEADIVQTPVPIPPAPVEELLPPAPVEELPEKPVVVTVIPTPKKARARTRKIEEEAQPLPPVLKPLKVIRRRREETPKVFETAAKSLPRAMLEGIDIELGENNPGHID